MSSKEKYDPACNITTFDDYMKLRVDNQIRWYDNKSTTQKRLFYLLRLLTLVSSIFIPFTAGLVEYSSGFLILTSVLGLVSAISEGISSFTKVHEKWIQYRRIVESLKHEKYMFLMRAGIYDDSEVDLEKTFVSRIESLVSSENINWANMNSNLKGDKK